MPRIMHLEFSENEYIDIEMRPDEHSTGVGLGGKERVLRISKSIYDKSLSTVVSMLRETSKKVKDNFDDTNIENVSITVGATFGVEGNILLAKSTTEATLSITVTLKG